MVHTGQDQKDTNIQLFASKGKIVKSPQLYSPLPWVSLKQTHRVTRPTSTHINTVFQDPDHSHILTRKRFWGESLLLIIQFVLAKGTGFAWSLIILIQVMHVLSNQKGQSNPRGQTFQPSVENIENSRWLELGMKTWHWDSRNKISSTAITFISRHI